MRLFTRKHGEGGPARRRGWGVPLALAAAVFFGLVLYMRSVERAAISSALINDQIDATGHARPVADVAQAIRSMKLVTVEVATKVTSESAHDSWRGAVDAKVTVPVRLLYGADLSRVEAKNLAYSGLERTWLVTVPLPERIATEVCTDSEQAEVEVGWMRLRSRAGEYYLGLARQALSERARGLTLTREDSEYVRKTTTEQISRLLGKIVGSDAEIVVRYDEGFPSGPALGGGPEGGAAAAVTERAP